MTARGEKARQFAHRHWVILAFLAAAAALVMKPHALERYFVYYPDKNVEGDPSRLALTYETLRLTTEDGIRLHGWFVPCSGCRRTFLVLHGNAGNIGHRLPWIEMLHGLQAQVLIIDYRGYGLSEGKPFEDGLYRDARAASSWWAGRFTGSDQRLILIGESLGGAVAVDLATHVQASGLILQSTFPSAWDMAKTMFPIGLLQPLTGVRFDSAAKIRGVKCPKLFIHGNRDEIVPFRLGRKFFELSPEPKQFWEVPGAGHNDLIWVAGPDYNRAISEFLRQFDL